MTADELPDGWALATLAELVSPSSEKVEPEDRPNSPYLSLEHVEPHTNRIIGQGTGADVGSTKAVFRAGDVLYGKLRPYLNKVAIPDFDGICSTDILVFRQVAHLDAKFLMRLLSRREVVDFANHNSAGVQLPRISFKELGTLEIPLPSLAEQRRIVAAVERILDKVTAARARLDRVPTTLKRFRQAVLAAACSGRLTADWRRDALAVPMNEVSFSPVDAPEIPPTWKWAKLSDIARVKGGVTKGRKLPADGRIELPYLRVANVQDGFLDLQEIKSIPAVEADRAKYALLLGDVLFTEGGNREHLGRGAVWRGEIPDCIHQNHIFRARITTPRITSEFVSLASKSEFSREYFFANASQTVNLASINLKSLSALPIPLPPLAEQQEIVKRVSALFARADAIEAAVTAARKRVDALTQAVLAKAFRGELVPTEAELARRENRPYEPAADLLARVRASAATPAAKPRRGRKAAAEVNEAAVGMLAFAVATATEAGSLNRTKIQKFAAVLQTHHGVEIVARFLQAPFGPYAPELPDMEPVCAERGYFTTKLEPKGDTKGEYQYVAGENAEAGRAAGVKWLGGNAADAEKLLRLIRAMTTDEAELFATVYAVWNDLIIDGKPVDDAAVIARVYGWNVKKKKFAPAVITAAIARLRSEGYVPTGQGKRTEAIPKKRGKPKP